MSKQEILRELEACKPGDLISVHWCDASVGRSSSNGGRIEVPVCSWGVYLAIMGGKRSRQIVIAQNIFWISDSMFDCDYASVPLGFTVEIRCIQPGHLPAATVAGLLRSFTVEVHPRRSTGGLRSSRMVHHRVQQRLSIHGRPR